MTAVLVIVSCPTCAPAVFHRPAVKSHHNGFAYVADRARWIVRHPERLAGVEIRGDGRFDGLSWIGHRATAGDREWQATEMDTDGPVGDCRRDDLGVALDDRGARGTISALLSREAACRGVSVARLRQAVEGRGNQLVRVRARRGA